MNNMKLNAARSLLIIALLCPFALADGDQGSGGFADGGDPVITACESSVEGDQGSGGFTSGSCEDSGYIDSLAVLVSDYLDSIF